MIHKADNYYCVKDYAKLCGVSVRNIRDRIRARSIQFMKIDCFYFVNVVASPPVNRINPNRPVRGAAWSLDPFPFKGLREVGFLARGKHYSESIIYEAIIIGKLDGYIIGDKVFVYPHAAEQFYRNRDQASASRISAESQSMKQIVSGNALETIPNCQPSIAGCPLRLPTTNRQQRDAADGC